MIIVNGHNKARALYHAVEGPVMQMWTISALQMHEKGITVSDDAATEELKGGYRYFKDIEAEHWMVESFAEISKLIKVLSPPPILPLVCILFVHRCFRVSGEMKG